MVDPDGKAPNGMDAEFIRESTQWFWSSSGVQLSERWDCTGTCYYMDPYGYLLKTTEGAVGNQENMYIASTFSGFVDNQNRFNRNYNKWKTYDMNFIKELYTIATLEAGGNTYEENFGAALIVSQIMLKVLAHVKGEQEPGFVGKHLGGRDKIEVYEPKTPNSKYSTLYDMSFAEAFSNPSYQNRYQPRMRGAIAALSGAHPDYTQGAYFWNTKDNLTRNFRQGVANGIYEIIFSYGGNSFLRYTTKDKHSFNRKWP